MSKKVRVVFFVAVLLLVSFGLSANGSKEASNKIRVATKATMEGSIVQYAYDKGYFADEGLDVEIIMFTTGAPINEAIAANEADIAASGNATIFSLARGECVFLAELVSASGGMGIYARPDSPLLTVRGQIADAPNIYGSAETIKGKSFLGTLGTSMQLNVLKYAEKFGLKNTEVKIINMDMGPAFQAFISGEGDAIATCAPYSFDLLDRGYVEVASYYDSCGDICDGLFARKDFVEKNRENVVKFVRAMMRASKDLQDKEVASAFCIPFYNANGKNYTQELLDSELSSKSYLNVETFGAPDYVFGGSFLGQVDFFVSLGTIEKDKAGNVAASCDPSILNEALGLNLK